MKFPNLRNTIVKLVQKIIQYLGVGRIAFRLQRPSRYAYILWLVGYVILQHSLQVVVLSCGQHMPNLVSSEDQRRDAFAGKFIFPSPHAASLCTKLVRSFSNEFDILQFRSLFGNCGMKIISRINNPISGIAASGQEVAKNKPDQSPGETPNNVPEGGGWIDRHPYLAPFLVCFIFGTLFGYAPWRKSELPKSDHKPKPPEWYFS